jgi:hypothetical protein
MLKNNLFYLIPLWSFVQNEQDLYYTSKAHGLTPFAAAIISYYLQKNM